MKKINKLICSIIGHKLKENRWFNDDESAVEISNDCSRCGIKRIGFSHMEQRFFECLLCGKYVDQWEGGESFQFCLEDKVGFCGECYQKFGKNVDIGTLKRLYNNNIPINIENIYKHNHSNVDYDSNICGYRAYHTEPCKECGWKPTPLGVIGSSLLDFKEEEGD